MLGSFLFKRRMSAGQSPGRVLSSAVLVYMLCHLAAALTADQAGVCPFQRQVAFIGFIVLEMCLGLYFPALATLRSLILPSSHRFAALAILMIVTHYQGRLIIILSSFRSTIINLFRIPLNLITVAILLCIKQGLVEKKLYIFSINVVLGLIGLLSVRSIDVEKKKVKSS